MILPLALLLIAAQTPGGLSQRSDVIIERNVVHEARRFLRERGLLARLPRRARREGLASYASRLERLCGVPRWSLLRVQEGRISIVAPGARETSKERRNWLCAVNAVVAAGFSVPPVYSPVYIPHLQ